MNIDFNALKKIYDSVKYDIKFILSKIYFSIFTIFFYVLHFLYRFWIIKIKHFDIYNCDISIILFLMHEDRKVDNETLKECSYLCKMYNAGFIGNAKSSRNIIFIFNNTQVEDLPDDIEINIKIYSNIICNLFFKQMIPSVFETFKKTELGYDFFVNPSIKVPTEIEMATNYYKEMSQFSKVTHDIYGENLRKLCILEYISLEYKESCSNILVAKTTPIFNDYISRSEKFIKSLDLYPLD